MSELLKTIERLRKNKNDISELNSKISQLKSDEEEILRNCGDLSGLSVEDEERRIKSINETIAIVSSDDAKKALENEVNDIKYNIDQFKVLMAVRKSKDDHKKVLSEMLAEFDKDYQIYLSERESFEREMAAVREGKFEEKPKKVFTVVKKDKKYGLKSEEEKLPQPEPVVKETEEFVEETMHPLNVLCGVMEKFHKVYCYETKTKGECYSDSKMQRFWSEINISRDQVKQIMKICYEEKIPGMTEEQVLKLKLSLPTELLSTLGRKDIIKVRSRKTPVYNQENIRNMWREKFTYGLICQLRDLVMTKIEISKADDAKYEDVLLYEDSITQFMEQNTDHVEKDSGFFKCDKAVYEAFCVVEE